MGSIVTRLMGYMTSVPESPFDQRGTIAKDTISRSVTIVNAHKEDGATNDSTFLTLEQLLLDSSQCPQFLPSKVQVINSDTFAAARKIGEDSPEARGKISVLNLASDEYPGGGWINSLSKTQEEALCYSSTLYSTLKPEYYPWPNTGPGSAAGVYSPGVVVFKDDLDHDCLELLVEKRLVLSVITVAAPRRRPLTQDSSTFRDPSVLEDLRGKIRLVYRMAARHNQQFLVLGAFGCGAYRCPPELVAAVMKSILLDEFKGWFRMVTFAVYGRGEIGERNLDVFSRAFSGVSIN